MTEPTTWPSPRELDWSMNPSLDREPCPNCGAATVFQGDYRILEHTDDCVFTRIGWRQKLVTYHGSD